MIKVAFSTNSSLNYVQRHNRMNESNWTISLYKKTFVETKYLESSWINFTKCVYYENV